MTTYLSKNFSLEELTVSQTAVRFNIDNTPSPDIVKNLTKLAAVLEQVRTELGGVPIVINSGYRSTFVNEAVGGSKTSAHTSGLAADFIAPKFGDVMAVAKKIAASGIVFDQLIYEFEQWVHIGLAKDGAIPRRQVLSAHKAGEFLVGIV